MAVEQQDAVARIEQHHPGHLAQRTPRGEGRNPSVLRCLAHP
ncbi:hypothetical protein ACFVW2_16485 [Streptomyces sp. NPDC058171]